jgi:hypothetical protein
MRLKLTNFIGSKIVELENDDGFMEKGLFIPIDRNELYKNERNDIFIQAFVNEKTTNTNDGASHYIKQKVSKNHLAVLRDLGYESPVLGVLFESKGYQTRHQQRDGAKIGLVGNRVKIMSDYGAEE